MASPASGRRSLDKAGAGSSIAEDDVAQNPGSSSVEHDSAAPHGEDDRDVADASAPLSTAAQGISLDPGSSPDAATTSAQNPDSNPNTTITTSSGETLPAVLIPPYWQTHTHSHTRSISSGSALSLSQGRPGAAAIRMEDATTGEDEALGVKSPLWARVVCIDGHTVVSGNLNLNVAGVGVGVGDYVVWSCRVRMIDGGEVQLHKRYSEFEALRRELATSFPRAGSSLPGLPAKSVFYRFRPAFLEKRRAGLEYFLK